MGSLPWQQSEIGHIGHFCVEKLRVCGEMEKSVCSINALSDDDSPFKASKQSNPLCKSILCAVFGPDIIICIFSEKLHYSARQCPV